MLGLDTIISELKKLREDFQTFVKLEERRWEENNRRWEENNKRWEEAYKRFEAIEKKLLEHDKRFEAIERKLLEHDKRFDSVERRLMALGARWGVESEDAFRNVMRRLLRRFLVLQRLGSGGTMTRLERSWDTHHG